jgi:hypothetical protein
MNIKQIIFEEIIKHYINESDIDYDMYEYRDELMRDTLGDFMYNNNESFSKEIPWRVAPSNRIKKIWEDYIKYGHVRDEKGIDLIERIFTKNILLMDVLGELTGRSSVSPEEELDDYFKYSIDNYFNGELDSPMEQNVKKLFDKYLHENYYQNGYKPEDFVENVTDEDEQINIAIIKKELEELLLEKFYDYYTAKGYTSDYGLEPLLRNLQELRKVSTYEEKLHYLDRILNVVHYTSDLADWFVQGGSDALTDISGYEHSENMIDRNQYGSNVQGNLEPSQ